MPSEAHARFTARLVPDQQTDQILDSLAGHLDDHTPVGTHLAIERHEPGAPAAHIARDHWALLAAESALEAVYGVRPLRVRMGGTLPVAEIFQRVMGLATVYFSFSTGDEDFHAPNEFFRLHRLHEGLAAWVHLWAALGERAA